jgi:hypothetical protein
MGFCEPQDQDTDAIVAVTKHGGGGRASDHVRADEPQDRSNAAALRTEFARKKGWVPRGDSKNDAGG